MPMKEDSNCIN